MLEDKVCQVTSQIIYHLVLLQMSNCYYNFHVVITTSMLSLQFPCCHDNFHVVIWNVSTLLHIHNDVYKAMIYLACSNLQPYNSVLSVAKGLTETCF